MPPLSIDTTKLTKAVAILATIGAIFGAVLAVDDRYAHAVDLDKYQQRQTVEIRQQLYETRVQVLEDKLFELEAKDNKTSYDNALIERYKRRLEEAKGMTK